MTIRNRALRRAAAVAVALGLAAGAVACSPTSGNGDGSGSSELTKVRFGLPSVMGANNSPLAVAVAGGYFEQEGLDVEIVNTTSASEGQALMTGKVDIESATPGPILQLQESGQEFVMVYNYLRAPTGSIAVLEDSPIASLEDFAGTTIGADALGSGNILLTDGILASVDLAPGRDYEHLAVGVGAQAIHALESGRVDALELWDTEYAAIEANGVPLRTFSSDSAEQLFSTTYMTSRTYADAHGDTIERFGRAMAQASLFTATNPEAALTMMYGAFPETRIAGTAEEEQLASDTIALQARLGILTAGDPATEGTWGAYSPEAVAEWVSFAQNSGVISTPLDAETLFTNEFSEAYNDFDDAEVIAEAEQWKP
ncbi:ABC transporter substrate-binding protein [Leucobacter rhizosphaerae]|uniref:ABC transporter substrate-binding protein n=1 Tax=Leucobacter rhizosphaerae TaxID=2932245 RepID=A0ABY4FTC4_9MICO|nr:ABC transporter substrate-binding protein [Leucobacter rhizosphaerae]UOQ59556.1 ABC transporter substrate-binding protein [Leucobacter rhizosphaerae]